MADALLIPHSEGSSLDVLLEECRAQVKAFKDGVNRGDSTSCAEIVRRAATGDDAALGTLLHDISRPIVEQKCRRQPHDVLEEIVQEVNLRLVRKFHNQKSPFRAGAFAEYHNFLNLTIHSVVYNLQTRGERFASLEALYDNYGIEPVALEPIAEIEQRTILNELLEVLLTPLEREALYRRYIIGETPGQIAEALRLIEPDMTQKKVQRLVERTLRKLRNNPLVQHLMQA